MCLCSLHGGTSIVAKLYKTVIVLASRLKCLVRVVENTFCRQTRRGFRDEGRSYTPKTMTRKFVAVFFFFDIVISTKKKKFLFYDVINTPKNCRLEKWRGRTQLNLHTILSGLNYFSGLKTETHTQQYQRQKNINTIKSFTTLIGLSFTWINAWKSVSFEYFQDYEAS